MQNPESTPTSKQQRSFMLARRLVLIAIFTLGVFGGGYYLGRRGFDIEYKGESNITINRRTPQNHEDLDFGLFWRVWDSLETNYLLKDEINKRDMIYGAISGMVSAVGDPYTFFLPPTDNSVVQEDLSGHFEGVGIQIGYKGSRLAVIAPLPGTPAESAGILAGDFIVGIVDEQRGIDLNTAGITIDEAVSSIRGPAGSKVTLVITRDESDDPILIDVARENIDVPSVSYKFVEHDGGKYAHVKIMRFVTATFGEWDEFVQAALVEDNLAGIVIDLRNNPGGILQSAVDVAGDFVETGSVVVVEESSTSGTYDYKTDSLPRLSKYPVVVLVNEGSASASEILAGALRDIRDFKIIGETSFGKGTIQEPRQLEGGAALHITTSRWLTPNKEWVHDKGIVPDVEIKDNLDTKEDEQLQSALSLF